MEAPKGMEGFAFLWKEEEPKKEEARGITGGNPSPEERDAAYRQIEEEHYKATFSRRK